MRLTMRLVKRKIAEEWSYEDRGKIIALLLFSFFLAAPLFSGEPLPLSVNGESALLMNAKTGAILYEKNGYVPRNTASTTKIATALLALKMSEGDLEQRITAKKEALVYITPQAKKQSNYRAPHYWLETDSTQIGIKLGEEFSLKELLHALLLCTANDAANVIAEHFGRTIPHFMDSVNLYLKTIGCQNTHFNNPSGLSNPDHFTTAYDLACMAREGMRDPIFREIVKKTLYVCPQTNLTPERNLVQTNRLLKKGPFFYPKAVGVKTGTTSAAGKNLVAAAEDGERLLIAVALGYRGGRAELYQDVIKMFEAAFSQPKMRRYLFNKGPLKLEKWIKGGKTALRTYLPEGVYYDFYPAEESGVKAEVIWQQLTLPIMPDQPVGSIRVINSGGEILSETALLAKERVEGTLTHRLKKMMSSGTGRKPLYFTTGTLCALFCIFLFKRKRLARK